MLLDVSGGDQPFSKLRGNAPTFSSALMGIMKRSVAVGLGPPASDCERERETLAGARGGERDVGSGSSIGAGEPDMDEVGENVGKGDVDWDERDGCSSAWDDNVRERVGFWYPSVQHQGPRMKDQGETHP